MNNDLLNNTDIQSICQLIADVYKNKVTSAGYDPNGKLAKLKWTTSLNGTLFQLYFTLPDYWIYAEKGRGPGKFPPPEAIMKWIQIKRLVPRAVNGKVPTTKLLAYLIGRKIAREGTVGKPLLEETINETFDTLVDLLVVVITEALEKELEKDIEEI